MTAPTTDPGTTAPRRDRCLPEDAVGPRWSRPTCWSRTSPSTACAASTSRSGGAVAVADSSGRRPADNTGAPSELSATASAPPERLVDTAHAVDGDVLRQQVGLHRGVCRSAVSVGVPPATAEPWTVIVGAGCGHGCLPGTGLGRSDIDGLTLVHSISKWKSPSGRGAARGRRPSAAREHIARQALALFDRQGSRPPPSTTSPLPWGSDAGPSSATTSPNSMWCGGSSMPSWSVWPTSWGTRGRRADDGRPPPVGGGHQPVRGRRLDELRIRMALISTVPALVAHSALRYAEWCEVGPGSPPGGGGRPRRPGGRRWPGPPWAPPWPPF